MKQEQLEKPAVHVILMSREFNKQRLFRKFANRKNIQECGLKKSPGLSKPNNGKSIGKAGRHVK
jgi:hypothetical protein